MRNTTVIAAALFVPCAASVMVAQSLDDRIAAAPRTVAFEFETRANVCGDGRSVTVSDDSLTGWTTRSRRSGIRIGRHDSADPERLDDPLGGVLVPVNPDHQQTGDERYEHDQPARHAHRL